MNAACQTSPSGATPSNRIMPLDADSMLARKPMPCSKLEITFASNSSVIDPKFNDQMQNAANFAKAHPGKKLLVEGYTDNTGSAAINERMSQKRADTVRWVLVRDYGVNSADLKARGFGESNPIADNNTQIGRMANRRVVIKLVD